jgi:hypothetical protein
MVVSTCAGSNLFSPSFGRFHIGRYPVGPPQYCGGAAPSTHTHRRFITLGAVLPIDDTDFPFPLVESAESVKELLLAMKSKITELFGSGLALEAVVLLA